MKTQIYAVVAMALLIVFSFAPSYAQDEVVQETVSIRVLYRGQYTTFADIFARNLLVHCITKWSSEIASGQRTEFDPERDVVLCFDNKRQVEREQIRQSQLNAEYASEISTSMSTSSVEWFEFYRNSFYNGFIWNYGPQSVSNYTNNPVYSLWRQGNVTMTICKVSNFGAPCWYNLNTSYAYLGDGWHNFHSFVVQ